MMGQRQNYIAFISDIYLEVKGDGDTLHAANQIVRDEWMETKSIEHRKEIQ